MLQVIISPLSDTTHLTEDTMEEDMVGSLATDGVMAMGSACLATDTGITNPETPADPYS